ncbi:hypothetical protein ALC62_04496, partial [Cyphomyrmex costatus]
RVGHVKKALERPYTGPHKIIERISDCVFDIDVNGEKRSVSVENLKPAHFVRDDLSDIAPESEQPSSTPNNLQQLLLITLILSYLCKYYFIFVVTRGGVCGDWQLRSP